MRPYKAALGSTNRLLVPFVMSSGGDTSFTLRAKQDDRSKRFLHLGRNDRSFSERPADFFVTSSAVSTLVEMTKEAGDATQVMFPPGPRPICRGDESLSE